MARKDKLAAAARARAGKIRAPPTLDKIHENIPYEDEPENDMAPEVHAVESESDCGYRGGVNFEVSDDEPEQWTDSSDEESLFEFTDEELEENLGALRESEAELLKNFNAPATLEAYRDGLQTQDAQFRVRQFSSAKYKSHRHIPERIAQAFD